MNKLLQLLNVDDEVDTLVMIEFSLDNEAFELIPCAILEHGND